MAADEIFPGLHLGDLTDSLVADATGAYEGVLNVFDTPTLAGETHIPIMVAPERASEAQLDKAADWIDADLAQGRQVLVHCVGGIERAPLTVTWYLHKRWGYSLRDAFRIVQKARPVAQDRLSWLP